MENIATTIDAIGCKLVSDILRKFGSGRLHLKGSSMLPSLLPGDILIVRQQPLSQLATGDIVVFARNGHLITHRIVGKSCEGIRYLFTRGDSCEKPDAPISSHELLG